MNQRIRELVKLAQVNNLAIDTNGDPYDVKRLDPEKFAELIVRECSNFLKDTLDDHFAAEQLEEHFGVEE